MILIWSTKGTATPDTCNEDTLETFLHCTDEPINIASDFVGLSSIPCKRSHFDTAALQFSNISHVEAADEGVLDIYSVVSSA